MEVIGLDNITVEKRAFIKKLQSKINETNQNQITRNFNTTVASPRDQKINTIRNLNSTGFDEDKPKFVNSFNSIQRLPNKKLKIDNIDNRLGPKINWDTLNSAIQSSLEEIGKTKNEFMQFSTGEK